MPRVFIKMATRIRNGTWQEDEALEEDLQLYVSKNLKREEMLDFLPERYPMYAWSLLTLARRLNHFNIRYVERNTTLEGLLYSTKRNETKRNRAKPNETKTILQLNL